MYHSLTFEADFIYAMNLVIDSGNTAAKVGIFNHQKLVEKLTFSGSDELQTFMQDVNVENLLISSVKADATSIASWSPKAEKKYILDRSLPLPIKNLYKTPDTLGMDRLAGVCGARQLFPSTDCLVIDAGTCITYDFIDRAGNYHGGSISPGLNMRFQAVHTFTARLPLVSAKAPVELIGNSTEKSIRSGVINGLLAEIEGIMHQYDARFPGLRVILCGGDTLFFENQLKASIFASPELILIGLNSILLHNVNPS
jgi:pantothenate kinase, type III